MQKDLIVATFPRQAAAQARKLRDDLKSAGHRAFMSFDTSYNVHVNPPAEGCSNRAKWIASVEADTATLLRHA